MTYNEKLKDPRWQKKRLQIMERDDWKCSFCMNGKEMLIVHHKQYLDGNEPWDYPDNWLITICNSCHEKFHVKSKPLLISKSPDNSLEERKIKNISIRDSLMELRKGEK